MTASCFILRLITKGAKGGKATCAAIPPFTVETEGGDLCSHACLIAFIAAYTGGFSQRLET